MHLASTPDEQPLPKPVEAALVPSRPRRDRLIKSRRPARPPLNDIVVPIWCPIPVTIFLFALLIPTVASFNVGEFRLTLYRVFLISSFVPTFFSVFAGTRTKTLPCDWLMLVFGIWPFVAIVNHQGFASALETGGIHMVEGLGPFLLARCYIRDERSFRGLVLVLTYIVIGLAVFTIPEAITGKHFLRAVFGGSLTGGLDRRMGLDRAFGPFDHPILYGVFCASALSLAWFTLSADDRVRPSRLMRTGGILVSTLMSISGGPLTASICQIVAIAYDRITRKVPRRWLLFLLSFAVLWIVIDNASNRTPMRVFLTYLTFSSNTAYNRLIIWDYGKWDVWNNPIFGIGFKVWSKPSWMHSNSMDNFWLLIPVRFGVPAFLGVAGAVIYQLIRIGRKQSGIFLQDRCRKGWIFSMVGLIIAGSTVHYWNSLFAHFSFLVGIGAWMAAEPLVKNNKKTTVTSHVSER